MVEKGGLENDEIFYSVRILISLGTKSKESHTLKKIIDSRVEVRWDRGKMLCSCLLGQLQWVSWSFDFWNWRGRLFVSKWIMVLQRLFKCYSWCQKLYNWRIVYGDRNTFAGIVPKLGTVHRPWVNIMCTGVLLLYLNHIDISCPF